jgi:hypothetical protein
VPDCASKSFDNSTSAFAGSHAAQHSVSSADLAEVDMAVDMSSADAKPRVNFPRCFIGFPPKPVRHHAMTAFRPCPVGRRPRLSSLLSDLLSKLTLTKHVNSHFIWHCSKRCCLAAGRTKQSGNTAKGCEHGNSSVGISIETKGNHREHVELRVHANGAVAAP